MNVNKSQECSTAAPPKQTSLMRCLFCLVVFVCLSLNNSYRASSDNSKSQRLCHQRGKKSSQVTSVNTEMGLLAFPCSLNGPKLGRLHWFLEEPLVLWCWTWGAPCLLFSKQAPPYWGIKSQFRKLLSSHMRPLCRHQYNTYAYDQRR